MRGDPPILEQHTHLFRHDGHTEKGLVIGGIMHLVLALPCGAGGDILDQESMLERRARAFHFRGRTGEYAHAARLGEGRRRLPGFRGIFGPCIERADPVGADQIQRKAFDRIVIQHKAGCHDQEIIGQRLPAGGADGLGLRVDGCGCFRDQGNAPRQPVRGPRLRVGRRFQPCGHKR